MKPPVPGSQPNKWANVTVGDFPPEVHEANTAKPGVHYFENMTGSKAAGLLNKLAARFAKPRAVLSNKPPHIRKKKP